MGSCTCCFWVPAGGSGLFSRPSRLFLFCLSLRPPWIRRVTESRYFPAPAADLQLYWGEDHIVVLGLKEQPGRPQLRSRRVRPPKSADAAHWTHTQPAFHSLSCLQTLNSSSHRGGDDVKPPGDAGRSLETGVKAVSMATADPNTPFLTFP